MFPAFHMILSFQQKHEGILRFEEFSFSFISSWEVFYFDKKIDIHIFIQIFDTKSQLWILNHFSSLMEKASQKRE